MSPELRYLTARRAVAFEQLQALAKDAADEIATLNRRLDRGDIGGEHNISGAAQRLAECRRLTARIEALDEALSAFGGAS